MQNLEKTTEQDKIPVEQVLDDMYNPYGGMVSSAARDYYYINYASDAEQKEMDREDVAVSAIGWITVGVLLVFLVVEAVAPFLR